MDAFYLPRNDRAFEPTDHTIGPWSADAQHGGPPSALLGRALELTAGGEGKQVARITFDILAPVPIEPLVVTAEVVRPGRRVDLVQAEMTAGGRTVMTARAWRMRVGSFDLGTEAAKPIPGPEEGHEGETFRPPTDPNYLTSIDWTFVSGAFLAQGPAVAWLRMRHPLVAGEETTPLQRILVAVDSASGISAVLDPREWLFINTDLTVNLHRPARGEWIGLDASTVASPTGIGVATSVVHDTEGPIGVSSQSLLIEPHRPDG